MSASYLTPATTLSRSRQARAGSRSTSRIVLLPRYSPRLRHCGLRYILNSWSGGLCCLRLTAGEEWFVFRGQRPLTVPGSQTGRRTPWPRGPIHRVLTNSAFVYRQSGFPGRPHRSERAQFVNPSIRGLPRALFQMHDLAFVETVDAIGSNFSELWYRMSAWRGSESQAA